MISFSKKNVNLRIKWISIYLNHTSYFTNSFCKLMHNLFSSLNSEIREITANEDEEINKFLKTLK